MKARVVGESAESAGQTQSPAKADPRGDRVPYLRSAPMFVCHAIALVAPFFVRFHWSDVALAVGLYFARMAALSIGYHRYFAHRSYQTSRVFQLVLAVAGGTCTQRGALWWAANHRLHHAHSDGEADVHSPRQHGLYWSHLGWILSKRFEQARYDRIPDFARFPELRWLDRHHFMPSWLFLGGLFLWGGAEAAVWGCFVSTLFLWHGTFCVNSLAHVIGRQRFETGDDSRNSLFISLFTTGEGWHNNHHHFPASAALGFYWWEIDPGYWLLKLLEALGLVWDLKTPSPRVLAAAPVLKARR